MELSGLLRLTMKNILLMVAITSAQDLFPMCGIENVNNSIQERIVGGHETSPNQWPWMVRLNTPIATCGASLISDEWVMTAALCVMFTEKFQIVAGSHNLMSPDEPHRQIINSTEAHIHLGFDIWDQELKNNIALIKLPEPMTINEYVMPVCLPGKDQDVSVGDKVTATGWGLTKNVNESTDMLRMVELMVVSNEECGHGDDQVCTSTAGRKGTCVGDSGGPLIKKVDAAWIQQGITSWGPSDCATGIDGYTRVHYFMDWIENVTGIMIH